MLMSVTIEDKKWILSQTMKKHKLKANATTRQTGEKNRTQNLNSRLQVVRAVTSKDCRHGKPGTQYRKG
jgi:hypothetical protein